MPRLQFTSAEFGKFTDEWDIEHRTSSPGHQQANGMAEAAVKKAKGILKKATEPLIAIMEYRNTPQQDNLSPAQKMFGHMTRTLLPVCSKNLKPKDSETVKGNNKLRNWRKEWYYNKGAKDLDALQGDTVGLRPMVLTDKWRKGTVLQRHDERSYEVECEGTTYRRNRRDLRRTDERIDTPIKKQHK